MLMDTVAALATETVPWTTTWLPFFGSLAVALVALAGVVWASNKNARIITDTEILRHRNVVAEAHDVATRNEKVQVLLRLIDEVSVHILLTDDLIQIFRRFAGGERTVDIVGAQNAFNAHGAVLTSAESAAYLYAPESLIKIAQKVGKGAGDALAGVEDLDQSELRLRLKETHDSLTGHLSELVTAIQNELGLRPPDEPEPSAGHVTAPPAPTTTTA